MNKKTLLFVFLLACFVFFNGTPVFAAEISISCPKTLKCKDVVTASFIIKDAQAKKIEAWGMDIVTKGLTFVGVEKNGTLIEKTRTFDINIIGDNKLRCGSYFGEIQLQNNATLFILKFVLKEGVKQGEIRIVDAVDDLSEIQGSSAIISCK